MSEPTLPTPNLTAGNQAPETNPSAPSSQSPEPVGAVGTTLASGPAAAPAESPPAAVEPSPVTPLALTDFTLPEGITSEDPGVASFLEEANAAKLPKETAQKLLDQHATALRKAMEAPLQTFKDLNEKWVNEVKADAEIGGAKLDSVVKPAIARIIDQFGGDALRSALDLTGAGNNPTVIKAFYQIAQALTESGDHVGGTPAAAPKGPPAPAHAMYPHLVKEGN